MCDWQHRTHDAPGHTTMAQPRGRFWQCNSMTCYISPEVLGRLWFYMSGGRSRNQIPQRHLQQIFPSMPRQARLCQHITFITVRSPGLVNNRMTGSSSMSFLKLFDKAGFNFELHTRPEVPPGETRKNGGCLSQNFPHGICAIGSRAQPESTKACEPRVSFCLI